MKDAKYVGEFKSRYGFQTRSLIGARGKNETLKSPPRLGFICFETFDLNLI